MNRLSKISSTWSKLYALFNKEQKKIYASMVVYSFVGALLELLGIAVLLHVILSLLHPGFIDHNYFTSFLKSYLSITDDRTFVLLLSALLLVVYVLKNVGIVLTNSLQVKKAMKITDLLSEIEYQKVTKKELLYFTHNRSSDIINRLLVVSTQLAETILLPSIIMVSELGVVLLLLSGILFYQPWLFIMVTATLVPTAFALILLNRAKLNTEGKELNRQMPKIIENVSELTHGMSNLKLWNGGSYFHKRFKSYKTKVLDLKWSIYMSSNFIPIRIYEVIAIAGILVVVVYGVKSGYHIGVIVSFISIYAGIAFRLLPSINRIIGSSNQLSTHNYVLDYFNDSDDFQEEVVGEEAVIFNSRIRLDEICFGYSDEDVLHNLSLDINKGEFIGLVGASGAGKSTLVNVITSLIRPDKGTMTIDGVDLTSENLGGYRYLFSYVRQDVFMLNSSILENVAFLDKNPNIDKVKSCL
ncbi:MAG: ATP-binding cassette domain-containing protein, partial [Bacteroidia bacterium]